MSETARPHFSSALAAKVAAGMAVAVAAAWYGVYCASSARLYHRARDAGSRGHVVAAAVGFEVAAVRYPLSPFALSSRRALARLPPDARHQGSKAVRGDTPEVPAIVTSTCPTTPREGPSFDCGRAGSAVELTICADAGLARLDREMATAYEELLAGLGPNSPRAAQLKTEQRYWVVDRARCAVGEQASTTCIADAYRRRIAELARRRAG